MDSLHYNATPDPQEFSGSNAAVGGTLEDIGNAVPLRYQFDRVAVEIENTHASVALTGFALLGQAHPDGAFQTLLSAEAWRSPNALLLYISGDGYADALTAGQKALAMLDVTGLYSIKFQAKTGSSGSASVLGAATRTG